MSKKVTFVLNEQLLLQAREAVEAGLFKSLTAFIETAIKDELDLLKKENYRQAMLKTSQDPLFLADIHEFETDFESVDFDFVDQ